MSEPAPVKNGTKYLSIALVIGAWLAGAGMQWGIAKASQTDLERRVQVLEESMRSDTVPRHEYETWQKDIRDRLDEIENKLDRNFRSGGKQ